MTVREAIEQADAMRPNALPRSQKTAWLAQLDAALRRDVVVLHENPPEGGADIAADEDGLLLAGRADEGVYLSWLMAQADLAEGEMTRYNNDMLLYNTALAAFAARYKAGHRPLRRGQFVY